MQADTEARIRQRAYEIWLREGQPHGRDKDHWAMAAQEIAMENQPRESGGPIAGKARSKPAAKATRKKAAPTATTQAMAAEAAGAGKTAAKPRRRRQPKKTPDS